MKFSTPDQISPERRPEPEKTVKGQSELNKHLYSCWLSRCRRRSEFTLLFPLLAFLVLCPWPAMRAQPQPLPYDEGATGLAFALRKLPVTGSLLAITAHPDDEDNALLVLLGRGQGYRTGLFSLTRGDGGQNEIGPELFGALGILRTAELMSMHRWDGAAQYFAPVSDFGYSFSVEETFEMWDYDQVLGDVVRVIRKFRPDVITILPRHGEGGGQHHQASARLGAAAFRLAGDPTKYPEQIRAGLRPWQAKKLFERIGSGIGPGQESETENIYSISCNMVDPLFGKTPWEVGMVERSMHRCQGMAQITPLPRSYDSKWQLIDATVEASPSGSDLFSGIETGLGRLLSYLDPEEAMPSLRAELRVLESAIGEAQSQFSFGRPEKIAPILARGLQAVRSLSETVKNSHLSEDAAYELLFLLNEKENQFEQALSLSLGTRVEAISEDGTVIPGQTFLISVNLSKAGSEPLEVQAVSVRVPHGWEVETAGDSGPFEESLMLEGFQASERTYQVTVPNGAEPSRPYWTTSKDGSGRLEILEPAFLDLPWKPPLASVTVRYRVHGVTVTIDQPIQHRYVGPWVGGEQRHRLMVVPALSLEASPDVAVLSVSSQTRPLELQIKAVYNGEKPVEATIRPILPDGWKAQPDKTQVQLERDGQAVTPLFTIQPPADLKEGDYTVRTVGEIESRTYSEGHRFIDYDHVEKRVFYRPAEVSVKALDVRVAAGLKVGYIGGVGDQVPAALKQLNVDFESIDREVLTREDLSRFDVIVTGVRAYLVREDLKSFNSRLLEWVRRGGVLLVQYNKFEFNSARRGEDGRPEMGPSLYSPFPAQVGRGRVTDERAPIQILEPDHPVFNHPNRLTASDWEGWVQERGLYFLGEKDPRYRDLISTRDPFEYNQEEQLGSLVIADYGEGKWVYIGLGLWRQLPAGVPGAYRLLANLLSLGCGQ